MEDDAKRQFMSLYRSTFDRWRIDMDQFIAGEPCVTVGEHDEPRNN